MLTTLRSNALIAQATLLLGALLASAACSSSSTETAHGSLLPDIHVDIGGSTFKDAGIDTAKPLDASQPLDLVAKPDQSASGDIGLTPDVAATDANAKDTVGNDVTSALSCAGRCGIYDAEQSCQCDDYCKTSGDCCSDYNTLCGAPPCAKDADCDDFDPCTADACSGGSCQHTGNGSCCKADADCDDADACTTDTCTSAGCQHKTKTCNDGLSCTTDTCEPKTGACTAKAKFGSCAIDGVCRVAGETADSTCLACDPTKSQSAWTLKVGASCDDGVACTNQDTCDAKGQCAGQAKSGCCKTSADCAGADPCTAGTCNVGTGICTFAPNAACCAAGSCCDTALQTVKAKGSACAATVLQVDYACNGSAAVTREGVAGCDGVSPTGCATAAASLSWSPWKTLATCTASQKCVEHAGNAPTCETLTTTACSKAADCDDKNPCTDDSCAAGTCSSLPKSCPAGGACQQGVCDPAAGGCTLAVQDGSCLIAGQCLASGAKDPTDACQTCTPAKSQTAWSLTSGCSCSSGVCCDIAKGKIHPFGTACSDVVKATEYACNASGSAVQVRKAFQGCTGKSNTCSVTASNYAWSAWTDDKVCAAGTTCEVTDPTQPGTCKAGADPLCGQPDLYEPGASIKTAWNLGTFPDDTPSLVVDPKVLLGSATDVDVLRWSVLDAYNAVAPLVSVDWSASGSVKACVWYACGAGTNGTACKPVTCPAGAVSDTSTDVSGVTANGCCMTAASGGLAWVPTPSTGSDGSGSGWLSITNNAGKCQQVAVTLGFGKSTATACSPNTKCCTADGSFAAKATPCGTTTMAAEYKCDSTAKGGKILQRKAVSGCLGTSTTCSTSSANYAWSDWASIQTCAANEVCEVTALGTPGTCKAVTVCVPGNTCCAADGAWAAKGTTCGTTASKVEYQCIDAMLGGSAQVRKGYGGCTGTGSTCSVAAANLVWSPWFSYQTCAKTATCVAGASSNVPTTCQTPASNLCTTPDPSYGATTQDAPASLGEHGDGDSALWMVPKVALSSDTDKDFFKYLVNDNVNLSNPKMSITWSAAKPVTVCGYYQCLNGPSSKNCDAVTCPVGSTASINTAVSTVSPNGCCMDGASGTLTFSPNAPGTMNETGWVHFSVKNKAGSGCQQVAVKTAFGDDLTTQCDPTVSCCGDAGAWDAKGTACGAVVKSEYQCSKFTTGGIMQERDATGTCGGSSSTCGSGTTAWGPWTTSLACTDAEVCAVAVATSAGTCKPAGGGSCSGACGGKSKDGTCYCDSLCVGAGDCCADFAPKCAGSCAGSCGSQASDGVCWCDGFCSQNGDCCLDKAAKCGG